MKTSYADTLIRALVAIEACATLGAAQQLARDAIGTPAVKVPKMSAEAFYEALSKAQACACEDEWRWDLRSYTCAGWAEWPTARNFKWRNQHGNIVTIKCPAQVKVPEARYWSGGVIPADLTVHPMVVTRRYCIAPFKQECDLPSDELLAGMDKGALAIDAVECRRLSREWAALAGEREAISKCAPNKMARNHAAWFAQQAHRLDAAAQGILS